MKKIGTIMLATFVSCVMVISGIAASGKNVYAADGDEVTVLETDQSEPREGNVLVGIKGTFTTEEKEEILAELNRIRKEACDEGQYKMDIYTGNHSSERLTSSDYVPLTWSNALEGFARIRAAEADISYTHKRPNSLGQQPYNVTYKGIKCDNENIAWNYGDVMGAIRQWYAEKDDWGVDDYEAGHYRTIINMEYKSFGMAGFKYENNPNRWYAFNGEFSKTADSNTSQDALKGEYIQLVEVDAGKISEVNVSGADKIIKGKTSPYSATAKMLLPSEIGSSYQYNSYGDIYKNVSWNSKNTAIATVDSKGIVSAKSNGTASIEASISSSLKGAKEVTVRSITSVENPDDITTASGTAPAAFPTKVIANWSDKTTSEETVTWDMTKDAETGKTVSSEYYKQRAGGTFTFGGKIENYSGTVKQKVVVAPAYIVEGGITIPEIVTESGVKPTVNNKILPKTLVVKWSNGDTTNEDVSWNEEGIIEEDYATIRGGEFKLSGTISENGVTKFVNTKYKVNPATVDSADFTSPIETKEMVAPVLPETVKVRWSNHKAAYDTDEQVEWEQVEESKYSKPNKDFTVKGKIWRYKNELEKTEKEYLKDISIKVEVVPKLLDEISWAEGSPSGTEFYKKYDVKNNKITGYDWSKVKGTIIASYDNNTTEEVDISDKRVTISGYSVDSTSDEQNVTLTFEYSYKTGIQDPESESSTKDISLVLKLYSPKALNITAPTNTEVIEGHDIDLTGLKVSTVYDDIAETTMEETSDAYAVSELDSNFIGEQDIEVSLKGFEGVKESFKANVIPKKVTAISVSEIPVYQKIGKELNINDVKLTATYNDNDKKEFSLSELIAKQESDNPYARITGYDKDKLGKQTITVTFYELVNGIDDMNTLTATQEIEVMDKIVTEVSITDKPTKLEYIEGQDIDLTGGKVLVRYDNDTQAEYEIKDEYLTKSEYDKTKIGTQKITVTRDGFSDDFEVNVRAKQIEKEYVTAPATVKYLLGQNLSLEGCSHVIRYDNGEEYSYDLADADSRAKDIRPLTTALKGSNAATASTTKMKDGDYKLSFTYKGTAIPFVDDLQAKTIKVLKPLAGTATTITTFTYPTDPTDADIKSRFVGKKMRISCVGGDSFIVKITEEMITRIETVDPDSVKSIVDKSVFPLPDNKVIKKLTLSFGTGSDGVESFTNIFITVNVSSPKNNPDTNPENPSGSDNTPIVKGSERTIGQVKYKVTASNTVSYKAPATKAAKNATSVTIPATVMINGKSYKVTAIEANAFKGNKKLKTVTIGKNITTIGKGAFSGCTALTTVKGGANVNTIGANAFMNCKQLKKYIVTSKVSKIGAKAFYGCKSLKNITINSKKLGKNSLGKKCFKAINKKAVIKVIKSKKKTYTSYINKSGIDKTTTVK